MKKHANLSIFVAHKGCPHRCAFCNQTEINGVSQQPTAESVRALCAEYLTKKREKGTEIAFFGGSFTAIERGYMVSLLDAAHEFVEDGFADGIRISTRPDAIDGEILDILKRRSVTAIELGAQSMSDDVLKKNGRGHTADDVRRASAMIKEYGFSLGLQMMTGMFGEADYREGARRTANELIALKPDCVRIYPTLTLKNTALCGYFERGEYIPLELEEAVDIAADLLEMFWQNGIDVIRIGLHDDVSLHAGYVAGPIHPAFGELCKSRVARREIERLLGGAKGRVSLEIPRGQTSIVLGQSRANAEYFSVRGVEISVAECDTPKIRILQE